MVNRNNIVYSIAAAQRILNIKTGLYQVQEWTHVVWVHGKNFCRFISKKLFKKHFADRRRAEAQNIDLLIDSQDDRHFTAMGSNGVYQIHTHDVGIKCTCEDYKNQIRIIGKGVCKHGYAVLNHLGFDSLADYLERDRTCERVPSIQDAPLYIPPRGERTERGRSID